MQGAQSVRFMPLPDVAQMNTAPALRDPVQDKQAKASAAAGHKTAHKAKSQTPEGYPLEVRDFRLKGPINQQGQRLQDSQEMAARAGSFFVAPFASPSIPSCGQSIVAATQHSAPVGALLASHAQAAELADAASASTAKAETPHRLARSLHVEDRAALHADAERTAQACARMLAAIASKAATASKASTGSIGSSQDNGQDNSTASTASALKRSDKAARMDTDTSAGGGSGARCIGGGADGGTPGAAARAMAPSVGDGAQALQAINGASESKGESSEGGARLQGPGAFRFPASEGVSPHQSAGGGVGEGWGPPTPSSIPISNPPKSSCESLISIEIQSSNRNADLENRINPAARDAAIESNESEIVETASRLMWKRQFRRMTVQESASAGRAMFRKSKPPSGFDVDSASRQTQWQAEKGGEDEPRDRNQRSGGSVAGVRR